MAEPSQALERLFRKRVPKDKASVAMLIVQESSADTYEFLREVALAVPYSLFMDRLSVQTFSRLQALALSDEFEEVEEEAKEVILGGRSPAEYREIPEYVEIRAKLRAAATSLSQPENAKEWLERQGGKQARRVLSRVLRASVADPREAARAAAEVLDREIPKTSRNADAPKTVHFDEEAQGLLEDALRRDREARGLPSGGEP